MAVSKKHLKRHIKWGVLALIVIDIAALLIFLGVRSRNLDRKMDAECYFPFCAYFFFVACGYFAGSYYRKLKDKQLFRRFAVTRILPVCVIYYLIRFFVPIPVLQEVSSDLQYLMQPFPDAIATTLVSVLLLVLFYQITRVLFHGETPKLITGLSRMFMCYWIIKIYDATIARPIQKMNPVLKLGTYVLILAASAIVLIRVYPQLDVYPNIWNNYLLDALKGPGGMM